MNEHVYRVTWEGVLVHNTCHLHHSIPKFLGGVNNQNLANIDARAHRLYHELLADTLYDKGLDLAPNASTGRWESYLRAEPWRQYAAFEACVQAVKELKKWGYDEDAMKIYKSFQTNMNENNYNSY
jgi:hypothetical protein